MRKNLLSITICGLNLHKVIAFFESSGITAYNLVRQEKSLSFSISPADYKKLRRWPLYKNYSVKKEVGGFKRLALAALSHAGLLVGIIFSVWACFFVTGRVQSIEIVCPPHACQNQHLCIYSPENQQKILELLGQNGIKKNAKLSSIASSRDIEKLLMQNFKQISGATLIKEGVNLKLELVEGKLPSFMLSSDLIAEASGILVSADVVSGKLVKPLGSIVLEGDTIVKAEGEKLVCATVTIRTFYHDTIIYNDEQVSYERTGNVKYVHDVFLKNPKEASSPFKLYESQQSTKFAFLNYFVPLKVRTTVFYELEAVTTTIPFKEKEADLKGQLEQKIKNSLPPNAAYRNTTFTAFSEGSRTRLDCYVEALLTIEK